MSSVVFVIAVVILVSAIIDTITDADPTPTYFMAIFIMAVAIFMKIEGL